MEVHLTGALCQLWAVVYHVIGYGVLLFDDLGWGDLVRVDFAPSMQVLALVAVAVLLTPVAVRWSGSLIRMTIVLMALMVPVWIVLPAL